METWYTLADRYLENTDIQRGEFVMSHSKPFCDGRSRRDFLHLGTANLFGLSLGLPELLRMRASATGQGQTTRDVSLIYLFLKGGLSTIDTWDLKPDAPAEFRGEFRPRSTNVTGIQVSEYMPRSAGQMDKFSLIRSFRHHDSSHGPSDHYMMTGYFPRAGFNGGLKPNNHQPAIGSIISNKLGPRNGVPPYVCLPTMHPSGSSAYLGSAHAPFVIEADPNAPNFSIPDLVPPLTLPSNRLEARQELLSQVDRYQQSVEMQANQHARAVGAFQTSAFTLMTSESARQAFDIQQESARLRDEYGRNTLGQSCLMARRLVEAGVRCVTIDHSNWDTHDNNFSTLRDRLLPALDTGIAALFRDLHDRGLLDSTLVLVSGEFGRTPRINNNAGRDHWGPAFTVAIGGGGIRGGRVVGSTNARAERPADNPYGPEDLFATVCQLMGINPADEFYTPEGRPVQIVNNGRAIRELL
jgi:uncharacterized protein (DUF1501 family)